MPQTCSLGNYKEKANVLTDNLPCAIGLVFKYCNLQNRSRCVLLVCQLFLIIGDVPILTTEDSIVSQPAKILNFLRKQVGGSF